GGEKKALLYGADESILGGLNAFYLLLDKPEIYGLPSNPKVPSRGVPRSSLWSILVALLTALGVLFSFRGRGRKKAPVPGPSLSPGGGGKKPEGKPLAPPALGVYSPVVGPFIEDGGKKGTGGPGKPTGRQP